MNVFLSYCHKDYDSVVAFKKALEKKAIRVWIDVDRIEVGENFTHKISEDLPKCSAVLAWYSDNFSKSNACHWELQTAYLAAQQKGHPCKRILVINPEKQDQHIKLPSGLSGQNRLSANENYDAAVDVVLLWLSKIDSPFGDIVPREKPSWYGRAVDQAQNFFGRTLCMWQIDDFLNGGSDQNAAAGYCVSSVQIRGLGGVGKSLLATEYALSFGHTYPAGIFWLRALGGDNQRISAEELEAARIDRITSFAKSLGISVNGMASEDIAASLARHFEQERQNNPRFSEKDRQYRFLWIVDDFPNYQDGATFKKWLAPSKYGHTLFTTRSFEYGNLGGKVLDLDILDDAAAYDLLTHHKKPRDSDDEKLAAKQIASEKLGRYPLALEIAAASLSISPSPTPFTDYLRSLQTSTSKMLEEGTAYLNELPTGHEKSIAATFLGSLRQLDSDGKKLLALASTLAPAPIPAELVTDIFRRIQNDGTVDANRNANLAVINARNLSLITIENDSPPKYVVHSLISKFVNFDKDCLKLVPTIRLAAIASLLDAFNNEENIAEWVGSDLWVKHAFQLIRSPYIEDGDLALMEGMKRYFFRRGDLTSANWNTSLASIYQAKGEFGESIDLLRKVLDFLNHKHASDTMAISTVMNNLGHSLNERENFEAALPYLGKSLALRKSLLGENHPGTIRITNNLALSLVGLGGRKNLESSVGMLEEALQKFDEYLKFHPNDQIPLMYQLAVAYRKLHKVDKGKGLMKKAHTLSLKTNKDPNHIWTVKIEQKQAGLAQDEWLDRSISWFKSLAESAGR